MQKANAFMSLIIFTRQKHYMHCYGSLTQRLPRISSSRLFNRWCDTSASAFLLQSLFQIMITLWLYIYIFYHLFYFKSFFFLLFFLHSFVHCLYKISIISLSRSIGVSIYAILLQHTLPTPSIHWYFAFFLFSSGITNHNYAVIHKITSGRAIHQRHLLL